MDAVRFDALPRTVTVARPPRRGPRLSLRRLTLLAPTLALMAALLVAGPVLSALRIGTAGNDTLVGTNSADQFTGRAGNDLMRGLAGNDIYYFDDGFGNDTIEELATYKVGGKKKPGGIDALSFAKLNTGYLEIYLIRQWGPGWDQVYCSCIGNVALGASVVENATAGSFATADSPSDYDQILGGAEKNTLQPGGGAWDYLDDYGGWEPLDGDSRVALPASNDTYKGFGGHGGTVYVTDFGGTGDVLDLRPFAAGDVYIDAVNLDPDAPPPGGSGGNTTEESLQIVTGGTNQVLVRGHFSPFFHIGPATTSRDRSRRSSSPTGPSAASAASAAATGASASTAALGRGAELEQAAKKLLAEALRAQDLQDDRSQQRAGGGGGDVKTADADKQAKDKKAKKHDKRQNEKPTKHAKHAKHAK